MAKFTFDGEEFPMLSADDLTFAEGAAACRAAGVNASGLAEEKFEVLQALVWISVKRRRPEFMFSELNDVPVGAVAFFDDEKDAEPDPTEPEAEASTSSD